MFRIIKPSTNPITRPPSPVREKQPSPQAQDTLFRGQRPRPTSHQGGPGHQRPRAQAVPSRGRGWKQSVPIQGQQAQETPARDHGWQSAESPQTGNTPFRGGWATHANISHSRRAESGEHQDELTETDSLLEEELALEEIERIREDGIVKTDPISREELEEKLENIFDGEILYERLCTINAFAAARADNQITNAHYKILVDSTNYPQNEEGTFISSSSRNEFLNLMGVPPAKEGEEREARYTNIKISEDGHLVIKDDAGNARKITESGFFNFSLRIPKDEETIDNTDDTSNENNLFKHTAYLQKTDTGEWVLYSSNYNILNYRLSDASDDAGLRIGRLGHLKSYQLSHSKVLTALNEYLTSPDGGWTAKLWYTPMSEVRENINNDPDLGQRALIPLTDEEAHFPSYDSEDEPSDSAVSDEDDQNA